MRMITVEIPAMVLLPMPEISMKTNVKVVIPNIALSHFLVLFIINTLTRYGYNFHVYQHQLLRKGAFRW